MAEILSTNFKNDLTRLYVDDLVSNDYYLFVSSIDRITVENSLFSTNQFLEKTLFGKKFLTDDIHFMIRYYPWQRGEIFVQYDDTIDLDGQKFYCVVTPTNNDTGDYRVYKCLFNNYGATVQSPPNYNPITVDQIYHTADGYIWKFMYALTERQFEAYNALGYIPIIDPFTINPALSSGSPVSDIVVVNPDDNSGYVEASGSIVGNTVTNAVMIANGLDGQFVVDPITTFNPISNYYSGQYIYITNPNSTTFLYTITNYVFSTSTGNATIKVDGNPGVDGVQSNASVKIFPRVEILGDGTGARAIPNIVNGAIKTITVLNKGSGYTNLQASVVDPAFDFSPEDPATTDIRAEVRAILAPRGGHNYNLIDELVCKHFGMYAYITTDDNNKIGANNTYGIVGIVKNPLFANTTSGSFDPDANTVPVIFDNRIAITTDNIDRVTANTILTQINSNNEVTFAGRVHEIDLSSNTVYLAEYMGPYRNGANDDINFGISINTDLLFRNETGQTIQINTPAANNIVVSPYIQRSGRVYYMRDFFALPRNEDSREEFKFVLEF